MTPVLFALFLLFNCGVYIGAAEDEPFRGDKVLRVSPSSNENLEALKSLEDDDAIKVDFWQHPSHVGNPVDIHVSAAYYSVLTKFFQSNGMVFTVLMSDVQSVVDKERQQVEIGERSGRAGYNYGQYHQIDQIVREVQTLANRYPRLAKVFSLGRSYESRNIQAIKISSGHGRKSFYFQCGIHAREWVSPATCMYIIKEMLTKYGQDSSITAMIDKMDWVIVPVVNVDGYVYTWNGNRMWRKTRKPNGGSYGTDPNRNWNYKWAAGGSSNNPSADTYHGTRPFSEVETRNVAHYLYKNRRNLAGYMDIHAYSQLWMTPWGYTKTYPNDYNEMKRVADIATNALRNAGYGTQYRAGTVSNIIYAASGGTIDWSYGVLGLVYSYGLELRDTGRYGFLLPANQIIPTVVETFAAIRAMAQAMRL